MAKQVYSFTKIEKKRTNAGLYTTVAGFLSVGGLIGLIVAAFVMKGALHPGPAVLAARHLYYLWPDFLGQNPPERTMIHMAHFSAWDI